MFEALFNLQKESFYSKRPPNIDERLDKLNKLDKWIIRNRDKIKEATFADFQKSPEETDLSEIYPVLAEIRDAKKNLRKWIKPKRVSRTLILLSHRAFVKYEPKGVVLIISPWNYPFHLAIAPLVSALAAGNSVILKPSEISIHTSTLIEKMANELFHEIEVKVVQGDKNTAIEFLKFSFDHIFFTGSTEAGKKVAEAAAYNLASTTLELGGKSPVIIDSTANLKQAAEKIVWGKFLNKGQTCVAPDYLLVHNKILTPFIESLLLQISRMYGKDNGYSNSHYPRIISETHHNKLWNMFEEAQKNGSKILYGGYFNADEKYIEPTVILTNCKTCKISVDEIFGPILPIIEYNSIEEAIKWIKERNPPLAIYIFSKDKKNIEIISNSTQSGGIGINEVVLQYDHQHLPFGGVKHSGIGRSHGYEGFKAFSNLRSYIKGGIFNLAKIIYPPFTKKKKLVIDFIIKYL